MGQTTEPTTEQIERHIAHARDDLKSNLEELEVRAKSAVDWRSQFERRPGALIAAAAIGGALLSALFTRR